MRRRLIAAVLLLNLVSWANSSAFCLSGLATMAARAASSVAAASSHTPHHPCCPRVQAKAAADTWTPLQPCDHGHRCCFVQNPQIPSNLPEGPRPAGQAASVANSPHAITVPVVAISTPQVKTARSYSKLSTVLRI